MVVRAEQERLTTLLKDTITLLCKNGLTFKSKFNIEALIGVTLDDNDIFLVSMNELIQTSCDPQPDMSGGDSDSDTSVKQHSRRRKRRRRSKVKEETEQVDLEDHSLSVKEPAEDSDPAGHQQADQEPATKKALIDPDDEIVLIKSEVEDHEGFATSSFQEGIEDQSSSFFQSPGTSQGFPVHSGQDASNSLLMQSYQQVHQSEQSSLQQPEGHGGPGQGGAGHGGPGQGDFSQQQIEEFGAMGHSFMEDGLCTTPQIHTDSAQRGASSEVHSRRFQCGYCGKQYQQKGHLREHIIGKHQSGKNFKCSYCSKSYKYQRSVKRHELHHKQT